MTGRASRATGTYHVQDEQVVSHELEARFVKVIRRTPAESGDALLFTTQGQNPMARIGRNVVGGRRRQRSPIDQPPPREILAIEAPIQTAFRQAIPLLRQ